MISSYTQLLGRRYGDRFDENAREFMGYIVEGAGRMKQLIEDLLAYSRVGTKGREFKPFSADSALDKALANLRTTAERAGADVTRERLPVVTGDEGQLAQVFQNLIGNAIKFRGDEAPRIHLFVSRQDPDWHFMLRDNGIGIEAQYFERIFMVFQRLHNRTEYPGTGIGLAICKKIVDRHGGRIWVDSHPGAGSTFFFTIPEKDHTDVHKN